MTAEGEVASGGEAAAEGEAAGGPAAGTFARLAPALAFDAALVALMLVAPRVAFAVPLGLGAWSMLKSWRAGDEERWRLSAEPIRFEKAP